jgi:thymidylate synthase (FAD)
VKVLDNGSVELIEKWGTDSQIIEAARMSTQKGFLGWGTPEKPGDERLLKYLWDHQHTTPFEMAGFTIEVKAPIMVFREWHRHRTQSYNEMSARYAPLPDENYVPELERLMSANSGTSNKQAQSANGVMLTEEAAAAWRQELIDVYAQLQAVYEKGIEIGVPKELARLPVPVGRYSRMRASANLLNWMRFLKLRCDSKAQWEIRMYANTIAERVLKAHFPRTYTVAAEALGLKA